MLLTTLVLAALVSLFSPASSPLRAAIPSGGVLRVGPGQPYTTIQAAVDAASSGDLVLVDPGQYPAFEIDGKGLSVVAAGGSFDVLESLPGAPAVRVRNVARPEQVTLVGVRIAHGFVDASALDVRDVSGAVRCSRLEVLEVRDVLGTQVRAAVSVENTRTFCLTDSQIWSGVPRLGSTIFAGGYAEGLSALELVDSFGSVQNVHLRGYDAGATYAGAALRVVGTSGVWIVDDLYASPQVTILRGGEGDVGGSAIHYIGPRARENFISTCGTIRFEPGVGTVQNGGYYAINGDGGIVGTGTGFETARRPDACPGSDYAQTSLDAPVANLGGTLNLQVWSLIPRRFVTFVALDSLYRVNLFGLRGRGLLDPSQPLQRLASGTTPGGNAVQLGLPIPLHPALIGLQLTFQSALGPVGGALESLSFPSFAVLTP